LVARRNARQKEERMEGARVVIYPDQLAGDLDAEIEAREKHIASLEQEKIEVARLKAARAALESATPKAVRKTRADKGVAKAKKGATKPEGWELAQAARAAGEVAGGKATF
jgi:hypothetical protein